MNEAASCLSGGHARQGGPVVAGQGVGVSFQEVESNVPLNLADDNARTSALKSSFLYVMSTKSFPSDLWTKPSGLWWEVTEQVR